MKTLPLSELTVVSVLYCVGETDEGAPDFDIEVLDEAARATATFPDKFAGKCDCCGQRLKYACEVVHLPTRAGFFVGRSCAAKIESLQRHLGRVENVSVALAERAACNRRESEFYAAAPAEIRVAWDWAKGEAGSRVAKDFVEKLRRYGSLSPAQLGCLVRMHGEHIEKLAIAATGIKCPAGRLQISGTVVSLKDTPEPARYGGTLHHWKLVLDLGNGVRVWGTCPEQLTPTHYLASGETDQRAAVGAAVQFTATVKPSARDPLFGFFSRPTKAGRR